MPNSNLQIISRLLDATVEELDISPQQYELAVHRYTDLGQWLVDQGFGDSDVYPQGSFRLGTVLRPIADGDFDIDLVFLRFLAKESITQDELRAQAGQLLRAYIAARGAGNGSPALKKRGRCWELIYLGDRFHMDVLPVIPDPDGDDTAVLLSDRDLFFWQHSNPIGYANWFWNSMGATVGVSRAQLAEALNRAVEDVPQLAGENRSATCSATAKAAPRHLLPRATPTTSQPPFSSRLWQPTPTAARATYSRHSRTQRAPPVPHRMAQRQLLGSESGPCRGELRGQVEFEPGPQETLRSVDRGSDSRYRPLGDQRRH